MNMSDIRLKLIDESPSFAHRLMVTNASKLYAFKTKEVEIDIFTKCFKCEQIYSLKKKAAKFRV